MSKKQPNNSKISTLKTALFLVNPNLQDKESAVDALFSMCKSDNKKLTLMKSLLQKFKLFNTEEYASALNRIAAKIKEDFPNYQNIRLFPTHKSDCIKSSFKIIYELKVLMRGKYGAYRIDTRQKLFDTKEHYYIKGTENPVSIVLIDDFVGSGDTIIKAINHIKEVMHPKTCKINCYCIAGMEKGINYIINEGHYVYCHKILKKGITESEIEADIPESKDIIIQLHRESLFNPSIHALGYDETEALLSFNKVSGNTPNNVFPIFWWDKDKNKNKRDTICYRG